MSAHSIPAWLNDDAQLGIPPRLVIKFKIYRSLRCEAVYTQIAAEIGDLENRRNVLKAWVWQSFDILWDLYSGNAAELDRVITALTIPVPQHQRYHNPAQGSTFSSPKAVVDIFYLDPPSSADELASNGSLLGQLSRDMRRRWPDLSLFQSSAEVYEDLCRTPSHLDLSDYTLDAIRNAMYQSQARKQFENDLRINVVSHLQTVAGALSESRDNNEWNLDHIHAKGSSAVEPTNILDGREKAEVIILFGPPGAGKTHTVRHFLSDHFGFYFQAGSLGRSNETVAIHDPRKESGPSDSIMLRELIEYATSLVSRDVCGTILTAFVERWLDTLLRCRFSIFLCFLESAIKWDAHTRRRLPSLWLALQTSAGATELFDAAFRLASLCDAGEDENKDDYDLLPVSQYKHLVTDIDLPDLRLFYCLDEAQADLNLVIYSEATLFQPTENKSLLNLWANAFAKFSINLFEDLFVSGKLDGRFSRGPGTSIFTGTSLRLKSAIPELKHLAHRIIPRRHTFDEAIDNWLADSTTRIFTVTEFPLIEMSHLSRILDNHDIQRLIIGYLDEDLLKQAILEQGRPLLGRPRWTALYLNEVYRRLTSGISQKPDTLISDAASAIVVQVKDDLTRRLERIYRRTKERDSEEVFTLLRNLCRVVINSDLLDTGYAFLSPTDGTLISEGFAVMTGSAHSPQEKMVEILAVQAARDFFLKQDASTRKLVDTVVGEMIQTQQNDPRALGKTSEWFLAWNLYRAFHREGPRLYGSIDNQRSDQILALLSARSRALNNSNSKIDLSCHSIVTGQNIGYMYGAGDNNVELYEWLKSVRGCDSTTLHPNATYYFPDDHVGPDVIFAFELYKGGNRHVVLCLLQLKCGAFDLAKAIAVTNLSQAYKKRDKSGEVVSGYHEKRTKLKQELREWKSQTMIRILFTAGRPETEYQEKKPISAGVPGCREYYARLDESDTALFFGKNYDHFLNAKLGNRSRDGSSYFR